MTSESSKNPPIPSEIAGYSVTRMLGEGGMSVVYAAMQREPKRLVALKVLKGTSFPPISLRRFKREIEILGKLRHPGIAQVYDAGTWDDGGGMKPFFVMEYIPGACEFTDHMHKRDMTLEQRLKLFVRICAAVDHGHKRKIVHRDLKPGNILVDENGEVKIIDYGVARVSEVEVSAETMHTEAGRLIGTVQYMAPEQVDMAMQDIDGRCDVYALGVLLYQTCTGSMPHALDGQPLFEAMRTIREDAAPSPRQLNSEVDRDLETIIFKCLEKERGRRYVRAGELGRDLLRYLRNEPIEARRASPTYRVRLFCRRHRTVVLSSVIVAAVLLIAALAILFVPQWVNQRREATLQSQVEAARQSQAKAEADRDLALQQEVQQPWVPRQPYGLGGLSGSIEACMFDASGGSFCAVTKNSVGVWSLPDGRRWTDGDTGALSPRHIAYAHDGSVLAIAGRNEIACFDLISGVSHRWDLPRRDPVSLAVSDDGRSIAIGSDDFSISLHTIDGTSIGRTTSTSGDITHLLFGGDDAGQYIVGVSDERMALWRIDGTIRRDGDCEIPTGVLSAGLNRATGTICLMTDSGTLIQCPLSLDPSGIRRRTLVSAKVVQADFDPRGGFVLVVEESALSVWSIETLQQRTPAMPRNLDPAIYSLGPGGTSFARAEESGSVKITPLQ
tara:strand:- start:11750 stop:13762 length:2013 start_codon:yes stop_codon:yes gene_type:complete